MVAIFSHVGYYVPTVQLVVSNMMKREINDEFFACFMNTCIVFMLVMGWVSLIALERQPEFTSGTVEACLGSHCFEDSGSVDVQLEPMSTWKKPSAVITPAPAAKAYHINKTIQLSNEEFQCLARNIYFEARGESLIGQVAVAQITHNRLKSKRWGSTFCDVVYARKQFSWTFQAVRMQIPHGRDWLKSKAAAVEYLRGTRISNLAKADHYHNNTVNPYWNRAMKVKAKVGQHIFYASKD